MFLLLLLLSSQEPYDGRCCLAQLDDPSISILSRTGASKDKPPEGQFCPSRSLLGSVTFASHTGESVLVCDPTPSVIRRQSRGVQQEFTETLWMKQSIQRSYAEANVMVTHLCCPQVKLWVKQKDKLPDF